MKDPEAIPKSTTKAMVTLKVDASTHMTSNKIIAMNVVHICTLRVP